MTISEPVFIEDIIRQASMAKNTENHLLIRNLTEYFIITSPKLAMLYCD